MQITRRRGNPSLIKSGKDAEKKVREFFEANPGEYNVSEVARGTGLTWTRANAAIKRIEILTVA